MVLCLLVPATAFAAGVDPTKAACGAQGGAGAASAACDPGSNKGTDPITGPGGVLEKATIILAMIGGIAAVIIIIVAGLSMVTSDGDAGRVAGARRAIIGALVGLLLIATAASIVTFVVNKTG
jgi:hypothetical protein